MNADEQTIRDLVAQWHRATAAGDVDTVLGLMSEDAVFLVSGKPPMKGRSTFEKGLRGLLKSHRVDSAGDIQEVEVSGDLAYCWTMHRIARAFSRRRCQRAVGQRIVNFPEANERLMAVSARRESLATRIVTPPNKPLQPTVFPALRYEQQGGGQLVVCGREAPAEHDR